MKLGSWSKAKNHILEWEDTLWLAQKEGKKGEVSLAFLSSWIVLSFSFFPHWREISITSGFFGQRSTVVLTEMSVGEWLIVCLTLFHHWIFCSSPSKAYSDVTWATVAHTSCVFCPAWSQGSINTWPSRRCSCFCLEESGIHKPENRQNIYWEEKGRCDTGL